MLNAHWLALIQTKVGADRGAHCPVGGARTVHVAPGTMEDSLPDAIPEAEIAADRDELQAQADEALRAHLTGARS